MITVQKIDGTTAQIGGRRIDPASIVDVQAVNDFVVDLAACAVVAAKIQRVANGNPVVIRNMAADASHDMTSRTAQLATQSARKSAMSSRTWFGNGLVNGDACKSPANSAH